MSEIAKPWKVYMHISKIDGRAYCGITCKTLRTRFGTDGAGYDHCGRFAEAIKRDGWDSFDHFLIMPDGTREEAEALEQAIIKYCHLTDLQRGYNSYDGTINGIAISDTARRQLQHFYGLQKFFSSRRIRVYDKSGKYIKTFPTLRESAEYLGCKEHSIYEHISSKTHLKNGMYVRDESTHCNVLQLDKSEMLQYRDHSSKCIKVNQYDLNGKYLRTYPSIKAAVQDTGILRENLSQSLNGRNDRAGEYQWRYYDGSTDDIDVYVRKKPKSHISVYKEVYKLDPTSGAVIKKYHTISDAANSIGVHHNSISYACKHGTLSKGYRWRFVNECKGEE